MCYHRRVRCPPLVSGPLATLVCLCACAPAADSGTPAPAADAFTVVSFNSGTTEGLAHDDGSDDGYGSEQALISDTWYGDGLAWLPAVQAATDFFAGVQPDVVGFQEIFYSGECAQIPADAHAGFVCETWAEGAPTVAQQVLGPDYQVACHPGHPDKCVGVHTDFGSLRDCDGSLCLDGLAGSSVDGCGSGARVARAIVDRPDGSPLTVAHVHGSSGIGTEDQDCRVAQVDQVFVDLGDGVPAVNGSANLVLGDLNTDPGRQAGTDPSAARWNEFVGPGQDFGFHTEVGADATPTYGGLANIDHVASDGATGDCVAAGIGGGPAAVYAGVYFDHTPIVCTLELP